MSNKYFNKDTIAAIVTAPNAISGVGVIRVSGTRAWECVREIIFHRNDRRPFRAEDVDSHRLIRCLAIGSNKRLIDDGMFVYMKAPNSFTGEDVIELHLHGNPYLLRKVMYELNLLGAREALPGEFSFRAFNNGKLSLDQAESITDLISSRNEETSRRALEQLLGRPKQELAGIKQVLVDRLAEVEIDIDFSDQGLSSFDHRAWVNSLNRWIVRVTKIREEYQRSRPLREGIRLALVGEPNSGKSSLFNKLLGEERSIVNQQAGTTRDVVREAVEFGGLLFRVSDTAGIRTTDNEIEAEGIQRTFGEANNAHVVLWVFDGSVARPLEESAFSSAWSELRQCLSEATRIIPVWNKADLAGPPEGGWKKFFESKGLPFVAISALTGDGVSSLLDEITRTFSSEGDNQPDFWISRTRHYEVLGDAVEAVERAVGRVEAGEHFPDLLASDIKSALGFLGEITGEFTSDDLLNHIFAEFCIGK